MTKPLWTGEPIVEKFIVDLMEHHPCASVRIFVTLSEGGLAKAKSFGAGDFYSCMGYVREWLEIQEERNRIQVRQEESGNSDFLGKD